MTYIDFMSKPEDIVWIAYKLKNELGSRISINRFGLYKEILEGRYNLKGCDRGIDFSILYSDKEFLRVSVGETWVSARYEDKLFVLNEIKTVIGNIVRDGVSLGEPSVFYNIREDDYMIPHLEYVYADKEETIKAFQNNTIFDDGEVPCDLIVFNYLNEGGVVEINKSYSYIDKNRYVINIKAILENKNSVENEELKSLLIENLDNLFNSNSRNRKDNLLSEYVEYNNDIAYVTCVIKDAFLLASELKLMITITRDGKVIHFIDYNNDMLTNYVSNYEFGECDMDIIYSSVNGIKFKTKCDTSAYDLIEDVVRNELQKINNLRDTNIKHRVKNNQHLIKLVRRIGNK